MNGFVAIIILLVVQFTLSVGHLKAIKKQNVIISEKIDVIGELVDECQER